MAEVKKRRILSSDYDDMCDQIKKELDRRRGLKSRKNHETLWHEVDRQVRMEPMERTSDDPEEKWRSALELGDLSTACEVLSADVLRLMFPQDRAWLQPHIEIDMDRLSVREEVETDQPLSEKEQREIQKKADSELRAFMTQQMSDFGFRDRVELSVKEALKHGSFVAEVLWNENQQYKMQGVFESVAAPVWIPHSMWDCYPETMELGTDLLYKGSMIIVDQKDPNWIVRQENYINLKKFQQNTTDMKSPIERITWYGDITVNRKGENLFFPNMRIRICSDTVIEAIPMNNISIIYGGYDRVDVKDPYFMSPLVKNSPNHKLTTIIANRFLDNVELKLDPPLVYNGNDAKLIQQGGPKMIPGYKSPTKGGTQDFKAVDVGDPSWAISAMQFMKSETQVGTGVNAPRAGGQRQADRITATQIEQEAQGGEIRTVDFLGKMEKGVRSYCYIHHELNRDKLKKYYFYNPEMGMKDFDSIEKKDLPKRVHFEIVGSKAVLMERRRSAMTFEVTNFALANPVTAPLVNEVEVLKQMYQDAGNKTPERFLKVGDEQDQTQFLLQQVQEKAEETIAQMQQEVQKVGQDLVKSEQENQSLSQQLKIRNERALSNEDALRNEIQALKAEMRRTSQFVEQLNKLKEEADRAEEAKEPPKVEQPKPEPVVVQKEMDLSNDEPPIVISKPVQEFQLERDQNGDLAKIVPIMDPSKQSFNIEQFTNGKSMTIITGDEPEAVENG